MRALELYAGVGGFAEALGGAGEIAAAIELSDVAASVYRTNYSHPVCVKNIAGLDPGELAALAADLWWLSPPCQSFTARGARRDAADPRAQSFLHVIGVIERVRPRRIALENVPGFAGSRVHAALLEALARAGYAVRERVLCPTELGVPNRRARYYLIAAQGGLPPELPRPAVSPRPLAAFLDDDPGAELDVDPAAVHRYRWAMQILDPADPEAVATCFTSAYGRSWVRSGAYLYCDGRVRRFSPREIARLLGFSARFVLPASLPVSKQYALLGNSLSIDAVRMVLAGFTEPS